LNDSIDLINEVFRSALVEIEEFIEGLIEADVNRLTEILTKMVDLLLGLPLKPYIQNY
jgi:hypothetical protein